MAAPVPTVENRCDRARSLRPIRVALLCDYREEKWYSMDLVGDMLTDHLAREHENSVHAEQIVPQMSEPFGSRREGFLKNAHRALGRFVAYPREIRKLRDQFDLFHIVDHSYAHLALELPPERVIVTCHDLDAFSALLPGSPVALFVSSKTCPTDTRRPTACCVGCVCERCHAATIAAASIGSGRAHFCNPQWSASGVHRERKSQRRRSNRTIVKFRRIPRGTSRRQHN